MNSTKAWAIHDDSGINARSVSDTRQSAIVNYLCTERGLLAGWCLPYLQP